jgi:hypothetical protein
MRIPFLLALLCTVCAAMAQAEYPVDSIAPNLTGCWYAGDGGMEGYYCFYPHGNVSVVKKGNGRIKVDGEWEVDRKGMVTITSGKMKTRYLVERLADDGFILVTPKDGVRLEGHKEKPKGWK